MSWIAVGIAVAGVAATAASSATSKPKVKKHLYSDPLQAAAEGDFLSALKTNLASNQATLGDYTTALAATRPQARDIYDSDLAGLGKLFGNAVSYDPIATRERIRSGDIGAATDVLKQINWTDTNANKDLFAGLGRATPDSSWIRKLRTQTLARESLPLFSGIFNNLGADTSRITADQMNNILSALQLSQARRGLPTELAARELLPIQARNASMADILPQLGSLGQTLKGNLLGTEIRDNTLSRTLGTVGSGLSSVAGLYGAMSGGGMGGMGMGGGGGGGGANPYGGFNFNQAGAPTGFSPYNYGMSYAPPPALNSAYAGRANPYAGGWQAPNFNYGNYGMGGGYGGVNPYYGSSAPQMGGWWPGF